MSEPASDIVEDLRMVAPADPRAFAIGVAAAVAVCVAAILVVLYLRRRRKRLLGEASAAPPPERTALERLAAIRPWIADGRHREFVVEVSRILRFYIEDRFGLHAPHLSTEEFLFQAGSSPLLTPDWKTSLGEFLGQCDRVKFALANLEPPRLEDLYGTAEAFVTETTAAPQPSAPQPSPSTPAPARQP